MSGYSPLKVLRSAAGYYIGRVYYHPDGWTENGSRESDYYPTQEEAEQALSEGFTWRASAENLFLYRENPELVAELEQLT